jgi:uncharacterized Zn finger protein
METSCPFKECVVCKEQIQEYVSKCPYCGRVDPFVKPDRDIEKELRSVEK